MVSMIFKPAARYPADPRAVFILALSVFTGIIALVREQGPESLESALPTWGVLVWGVLLSIGSGLTLLGMSRQSVNGIITEQVGSVIVAATTIFYSIVAFMQIGLGAVQAVGIILAWGLSCVLRWFQLQSLLNDAAGRQAKMEYLARVEQQLKDRIERDRAREVNPLSDWRH